VSGRKYIRIALSADDEIAFSKAKSNAEVKTAIVMSDSQYALSLIRYHISRKLI
jgi:hypothetical protein